MSFHVHAVPGEGAEDVVVGLSGRHEGAAFTGTDDGSIFRISHDAQRIDRVAHTGGPPLGHRGRPRWWSARLRRPTRRAPGGSGLRPGGGRHRPGRRGPDGVLQQRRRRQREVWFSDSSTTFGIEQWKDDLVQNTRTGRLLRLDESGDVEVVLDGLALANGVALAADESFVAVAAAPGDPDPRPAAAQAEADGARPGVRRGGIPGPRRRRADRLVPHGHRCPGARRARVVRQPARARRCRPRSGHGRLDSTGTPA
jgi:hypothetical protein